MHTLSNWEWWVKFTALGIYDPSEISIRALFYFILFFILWSVFYFFDAIIVQDSLIYKSWLKKTGQMVQDNSV